MKKQMLTLWDLVDKVFPARQPRKLVASRQRPPSKPVAAPQRESKARTSVSMQDRYDAMTRDMLAKYGVRVRRWRTAMSGIAWELRYHDGRTARLIESPKPKGPMSAAIFLHEIGHHAIGFNTYKPRCREEYYAWAFAIEQMEKLGLNITDGVKRRMHDSLHYAVAKATRRGIKEIPAELEPYARKRWSKPV
jgi:hypothetical protein